MEKKDEINKESNVKEEAQNSKVNTLAKVLLIIFVVLLVILIILIIIGGIYFNNEKEKIISQNLNSLNTDQVILEYGEKLSYETILERIVKIDELYEGTNLDISINGETINPEEEYELKSVGDLKININTNNELLNIDISDEQEIIWKVEDTQKPILSGVKNRTIEEGEKIELKDGITAKDNVDGELEVTIEGEFNNKKAGKYTLKAKAIDRNNNEVEKTFTVTVEEKEEEPENEISTANNEKNNNSNNSNSNNNSVSNSNSNKNQSNNSNGNSNSSNNSNKNNSDSTSGSNNNNNSGSNGSGNSTDPTSTQSGRLALAKAEAKKVVSSIITSGMTKLEKAEAICYYITSTVSVQSNQSSEAYKTNYGNEAYAALILKKAACSGRCKAVTLLCDAAGLESQHINANQWTHQWNKIKIDDGSWIVIDAQIGYVGTRHPLDY